MTAWTKTLALLCALAPLACAAPSADERVAEDGEPVVGGVADTFRSYVVGVGQPYDLANPSNPSSGPFCSGTLISRRTVLTAAHCVGPPAQGGITAVFFGPDITSPLPASATVVAVVKTLVDPGFDPATALPSHDLALLELAADAPSQAVPLLRETMTNTPAFVGPYLAFAGYGNDGNGDYGVRRVAILPIERVGPDPQLGPIDATQLYYRGVTANTCDGDSGGPGLLRQGQVERLAGATSYGDQDCKLFGVDTRTDAPAIAAFIQPGIDAFEGTDPCRADGVCDESCNQKGQLVDPDCASSHCGEDGLCVLSCVDPPDPDCVLPAGDTHCGPDGVCDPTCAPADPDCLPPPDAGLGGGPGGGGGASQPGKGCSVSRGGGDEAAGPARGLIAMIVMGGVQRWHFARKRCVSRALRRARPPTAQ